MAASPMDKAGGLAPRFIENSHSKTVPKDLDKREDEDDDAVDIAADGTGPIRDGMIVSKFGELARQDDDPDG